MFQQHVPPRIIFLLLFATQSCFRGNTRAADFYSFLPAQSISYKVNLELL